MAATASKLILPPALGSYAFIWKPRPPMSGQGPDKYSITLLWPKKEAGSLKALRDAITAAAVSKWGPKAAAALTSGKLHNPLRDGDNDAPDGSAEAYAGHFFVRASSERKPGIVDENVEPIIEQDEAYSGCIFRASVSIFPFDKAGKKGVSVGLNNLQRVEKGERLDGTKSAAEDFKGFGSPSTDGDGGQEAGGGDDLF